MQLVVVKFKLVAVLLSVEIFQCLKQKQKSSTRAKNAIEHRHHFDLVITDLEL